MSLDLKNEDCYDEFVEVITKVIDISYGLSDDFFSDLEVGYTHSDFSKDNIIFEKGNAKILDFDRGRIAYQLQDIGRAIMTLMFDGESIDQDKLGWFCKGYNEVAVLSKDHCIKSLKLIWIIEVVWWLNNNNFGSQIKEKIREFRDEIIWITDNWDSLDEGMRFNMVVKISNKNPVTKKRSDYNSYTFDSGTVSFLSFEVYESIQNLEVKGICMKRFKGDVVTSGIDYTVRHVGDHFRIGNAEFIVSQIGKKCHQTECNIFDENSGCLLQQGVMFAELVETGAISINDEVEWL